MATPAHRLESLQTQRGGDGMTGVAVIVDRGDAARVVTVLFAAPPHLGDRFELDDAVWEIVRLKDAERGFVARPVSLPC